MGGTASRKSPEHLDVFVAGLDNSGKTAVMNSLNALSLRTYGHMPVGPTMGVERVQLTRDDGLKLVFTSCGGQRHMRPAWKQHFARADALVFVIDSADRPRLEEAGIELNRILLDESLARCPVVVLANKSERVSFLTGLDIAKGLDMSMIRGRYWEVVETSTVKKDDGGVQEAVEWLVYVLGKKIKPARRKGAGRSGGAGRGAGAAAAAGDSDENTDEDDDGGSGSGEEEEEEATDD